MCFGCIRWIAIENLILNFQISCEQMSNSRVHMQFASCAHPVGCRAKCSGIQEQARISGAFSFLRKMKPMRQIEVAELLAATGNFSVPYVKALFAATHRNIVARCIIYDAFYDYTKTVVNAMHAMRCSASLSRRSALNFP